MVARRVVEGINKGAFIFQIAKPFSFEAFNYSFPAYTLSRGCW
jgi:hypothetical protein